ncbi:hypothetical protein JCM8097_002377 [Rhodosporidiobolus ruineniae]
MSLPPTPDPSQPLAGPDPSSLAFPSSSQSPYSLPPPPFASTSSSTVYYDPAVAGGEDDGEMELPTPPATFFQLGGRSDGTTGAGKGKRRAEYQPSSGADSEDEPAVSPAGKKGKKRARSSPPPPAPSSSAPPQPRGRRLPLSTRIDAAGGLDKLQGTRFRFRQVGGPKGVVVPLLPEEVRAGAADGEEGEEGGVEVEELLERVKDPAFSSALVASLAADEQRYAATYEALAAELAKAQEEERVLNEVKRIVVAQRDTLRYGPQTRRAKAGGE